MTDATVTPIGIERSRRAHPSSLPAPAPLTITARQMLATRVVQWSMGRPMTAADVRAAVDLLLGLDDGEVGA